MSLFNKLTKRVNKMTNRAGGEAYRQDPKLALASILLTSFAQDQFYRSAKATYSGLELLLTKVNPLFAAKAAVYARHEYGMRSITHVLAVELAAYLSGKEWAKSFYDKVVFRPDDMLEIVAYYQAKGGETLPNAMKKGFAKAFDRFDAYQIAKYRGTRKAVKLVDIVNLVHPIPTQRNAKALQGLVTGTLVARNTWESKLTQAGQETTDAKEKAARKEATWRELILENKLGYFALLRNLRNILEQAPDLANEVLAILTDKHRIAKSKVLPFRYLTAMNALKGRHLPHQRSIVQGLNEAMDTALNNVPTFDGKTLVVLDDSGSMTWGRTPRGPSPIRIGAVFAAVLYKSNDADLMRFSDVASYQYPNPSDTTMSIAQGLIDKASSGGTNFHSVFKTAKKAYDRIIILSDMQGWVGHHTPTKALTDYKKRTGADPHLYSFDLQGYGSLQFPERNVYALAGFSEKVFDLMVVLEHDRDALVRAIEATVL